MSLSINLRRTTLTSPDDHDRHFRDSLALLSSVRASLSQALEQVSGKSPVASQSNEAGSVIKDEVTNLTLVAEASYNEYRGKNAAMMSGIIDFEEIRLAIDRISQPSNDHSQKD